MAKIRQSYRRAQWILSLTEQSLHWNSVISSNSGNLISHWNNNWTQFKDPISLASAAIGFWSPIPVATGSSPFNDKYFCHRIRWIRWKHLGKVGDVCGYCAYKKPSKSPQFHSQSDSSEKELWEEKPNSIDTNSIGSDLHEMRLWGWWSCDAFGQKKFC